MLNKRPLGSISWLNLFDQILSQNALLEHCSDMAQTPRRVECLDATL